MPKGHTLRYDDRVIALMRSNMTAKYVALALGITSRAVNMHRRDMEGPQRTYIDWPSDPAFYASRTVLEIAEDCGATYPAAYKHVTRNGIACIKGRWAKTERTKQRQYSPGLRPTIASYPERREFWEARTVVQMAELLGAPYKTVQAWARRKGYAMKRSIPVVVWPSDAAWWRGRTAEQIAKELGVSRFSVYHRARRLGMKYAKPLMSPYDYRANAWKHKDTPKRER